jgi:hypothetical protein
LVLSQKNNIYFCKSALKIARLPVPEASNVVEA